MMTGSFLLLALILGYSITVGLAMAATFGIAAASSDFVVRDSRIRRRYKFMQDGAWLLCTMAGAYATALVLGRDHRPWLGAAALVTTLIAMLWINSWEMRQRGIGHQILMSVLTVVGVGAGFALRLR
jgi:hypothetical protein